MIRTILLLLSIFSLKSPSLADVRYDSFTDLQVLYAKEEFNNIKGAFYNVPYMYSTLEIDRIIKSNKIIDIIQNRDKCQFAPDIENYARLLHNQVFEFVFGYMLINNICFKRDQELGFKYIDKSANNLYTEALVFKARSSPDKFRYLYSALILDSEQGLFDFCDQIILGNKDFLRPNLYLEIQDQLLSNKNNINIRKIYLNHIHKLIPEHLRKNFN